MITAAPSQARRRLAGVAHEDRRAVQLVEGVMGGRDVAVQRDRLFWTTLTLKPSCLSWWYGPF